MSRTTTRMATAAAVLALGASLVTPAAAHSDGEERGANSGGSERISTSGSCDSGSSWTLSGRSRFLQIDVEGRVDSERQFKRSRWVLRLEQNQTTVAVRSRKSSGGGGLKVKARVGNLPGPDTFTLIALNRTTGETCQGTLTF